MDSRQSAHPSRDKRRALISVQWVVVIGTSYLLLFNQGQVVEDLWVFTFVLVLLASILVFHKLPQTIFHHKLFPHVLVVVDTIFISLGIGLNRESPWDLFLIFFFGLFIAAIGESLIQIVMGCLILSILSVVIGPFPTMTRLQIDSDLLIRIPFLFGVFILYGYLAEQVKIERKRAGQRQAALQEVNSAITSTLDLRTVLGLLLEKIDLLLPYSAVTTVWLLDRETVELVPVASRNLDKKEWHTDQGRAGREPAQIVYENKASLIIGDVQVDPRIRDPDFFHKHGLVSYLGVPMSGKGEVLGVLSFYTNGRHEFEGEEVEFLTTLAGQAAIAIDNSTLYEQTKKQAIELDNANKVKDEFLSVMSHELRTPLNVIVGYTDLLHDGMLGEINPDQEEALGKVISRSNDLLSMISSILEATSIEAEAIKLESHETNLKDFLKELRSSCDVPIGKELALNWDYPSDLPVVKTDREKLKLILQNLVNNAIKFTEKGHVTISARHNPKSGIIEFKVADTGAGIPQDALSIIFDMFRQVDSSETRAYGGVGLGLYIVKKFTEMLGGKVEVESELAKGSTFTLRFPLQP